MTNNTGNSTTLEKTNNTQSAAKSRITTVKATNYMKEWLQFHSIKKVITSDNDGHLYFTAKNYPSNEHRQIKIEMQADKDGYCNIYERTVIEDAWDWIDAIQLYVVEE